MTWPKCAGQGFPRPSDGGSRRTSDADVIIRGFGAGLGLVLGLGVMRWWVDSVVLSMGRGEDVGADWIVSSLPDSGVFTATWVTLTISPIGSSAVTGKYLSSHHQTETGR